MDLFSTDLSQTDNFETPLADRLRPATLDEVIGQQHLLAEDKPLRQLLKQGKTPSMILWGPPGSGKTTLARVIAQHTRNHFSEFSAVMSGISDIKRVVEEATTRRNMYQRGTVVFIDEIHRFNKAQQDAFLPHVESGTFVLIGATTENPSFSINRALLSRSRTFILEPLSVDELLQVLKRGVSYLQEQTDSKVSLHEDAEKYLIASSDGDARRLLTSLESVVAAIATEGSTEITVGLDEIRSALQLKTLPFDRNGEEHYAVISALHKSIRDSDPDGSVYWLSRMIEAGEDPMYVARRLVRAAAEDIGLADPQALILANATMQSTEKIGLPECSVLLAELALYLALAPKSNSAYLAYNSAKESVHTSINEPVPLHLRNASTAFLKSVGYGEGYKYAHNFKDAKVEQQHLPDSLRGTKFYASSGRGWEEEQGARDGTGSQQTNGDAQ